MGPYCADCGQHDVDYHRTFRVVVHDLLENLFHFEGKSFATVAGLLARPGKLTNEFIAGRRQNQVNPVRLYLFVSVLFFVGLALLNHGHLVSYDHAALDELQLTLQKEPLKEGRSSDGASWKLSTDAPSPSASEAPPVANASPTDPSAVDQPDQPAHPTDADALAPSLVRKLSGGTLTVGQIWSAVEHRIPTVVFLGVPLFALFLKLRFLGSGRYYIEHLVFSLHLHTWFFLVAMVGSGYANLAALGPDWISELFDWAIWLWMAWYVLASFRVVYRQGWRRAAVTVGLLSFLHGCALLFLVGLLMLGTVLWFAWT